MPPLPPQKTHLFFLFNLWHNHAVSLAWKIEVMCDLSLLHKRKKTLMIIFNSYIHSATNKSIYQMINHQFTCLIPTRLWASWRLFYLYLTVPGTQSWLRKCFVGKRDLCPHTGSNVNSSWHSKLSGIWILPTSPPPPPLPSPPSPSFRPSPLHLPYHHQFQHLLDSFLLIMHASMSLLALVLYTWTFLLCVQSFLPKFYCESPKHLFTLAFLCK